MKEKEEVNERTTKIIMLILISIILIKISLALTGPLTNNGRTITIWDDTDEQINDPDRAIENITFYANYTNSTGIILNETCRIQFQNYTGSMTSWINMTYDSTTKPWNYTTAFNYKGNLTYNINCSNNTFSLNISEYYNILNTIPSIRAENGAQWIDIDGNSGNHDRWGCSEDTPCYINFSQINNNTIYTKIITDPDINDNLTFSIGSNSTINTTIFTINTTTGVLLVNATLSIHNITNGQVELKVRDTESTEISALLVINITEVNDPPIFYGLQNFSVNATTPGNNFNATIYAIDEEAHLPLRFNITFSSCSPAAWSSRNTGPNCTIWNTTSYNLTYNSTAITIDFTPRGRDDAGDYFINFSVVDNASAFGFSNNAQTNYTINFTVKNVNEAPNLTSICNNLFTSNTTYLNISENSLFSCLINASDIDETANITFTSNQTWFLNDTNGTLNNYNSSLQINITPRDEQVGNWSINLSAYDNTGSIRKYDSKIIKFYVSNVHDPASIIPTTNFTGFTGNNYVIYINASDNDLLITNKNASDGGYNEILNFTTKNMSGSTIPWITITKIGDSENLSKASLTFSGNETTRGNTTINLSVTEANGSQTNFIFEIRIEGNFAPVWNLTTPTNFALEENTEFFLNLSLNASDQDNDQINFTYYNSSSLPFPNFWSGANINGIINFTPRDADVGYHNVTINATDGRTPTPIDVNFTINNVNTPPIFGTVNNETVNEDQQSNTITINIYDEDYNVTQKNFYNENTTFNYTISGPNTQLINLTLASAGNTFPSHNDLVIYTATFTPNKSDLGGSTQRNYTIYLQAQDQGGLNATTSFIITINSINHAPNLTRINNQSVYLGANLTIAFNVSDTEDLSTDAGGIYNFTYEFLNGSNFLNSSTFNLTRGIINVTINSTITGSYHINVSVNDSSNLGASTDFWINVYTTPYFINSQPAIYTSENSTVIINISANHSIGDNLNYSLIIDGVLRNSTITSGNGNTIQLSLYLNYTDETTCGGIKNLTINITNPIFSNTTITNLTINHTNKPVSFDSMIGNTTAGGSISYDLRDYFSDLDVNTDTCNNNTVTFTFLRLNSSFSQSNGIILTTTIANWTNTSNPIFNATSPVNGGTEYFQIIANDTYNIAKSNNFSINLTPSVTSVPSSGGGSVGGSGGATKPVSLKIIFPDKISAFKTDQITIPLTLLNSGTTTLTGIDLTSAIATDETINNDIKMSFGKTSFYSLNPGQQEFTNLTVLINTKKTGRFEILVNATVNNPEFSDWGKFFLDIVETNQTEVEQIILFTNELIVQNPECAELKEPLERAKKALTDGQADIAWQQTNEIVRACRNAIAQRPSILKNDGPSRDILIYLIFGTATILFLVFVYHIFNRLRMKHNYGIPIYSSTGELVPSY